MDAEYPSLSLDQWREQIGYNPWHFWGLSNAKVPVTSACNSLVKKYSWQNSDSAGREDIERSIKVAEDRILPYMNYRPAPSYRTVTLPFPRYPDENVSRLGYAGADGRWEAIRLPEGEIQAVGVEAFTVISAGEALVFSDSDSDGLNDIFTITVATSVTNTDEIAVYFAAADRMGESRSEKWRVKPVRVSISGGIATIIGRAWLVVKPALYEGVDTSTLDPSIAANFVTTLEVVRRYTNIDGTTSSDAQATLVWETPPFPYWAFTTPLVPGYDPAAQAWATARVVIRDGRNGIVALGESVYDASTGQWSSVPWYSSSHRFRPPDRVIIRYLAGVPLQGGKMDSRLATLIARFSAAEMSRRICACEPANRELYRWQFDLARTTGAADESYAATSAADIGNPFGTLRGQVYAWHEIKSNRIFRGFTV